MSTTTVSQLSFGSVINPVGGSLGDGSQTPMVAGRGGDHLVSEVHGRFYHMAYRGNVFYARSPVAGTIIPIDSDTTAGHYTFGLLNPSGSNVNLELLQVRCELSATSTGIAGEVYLFPFSGPVLTVILAGTTTVLANGVQNAMVLGGNTPKSSVLSVFTVAATQADKHAMGLGSFDAVTTSTSNHMLVNYDGSVIVPPGTLVGVAGSAAQTSIAHIEFMYAEVPV